MKTLLIATHNQGKIREYQQLLADLPFTVVSLNQLQITHDVDETGITFAENAILKANQYAQLSGMLTWADDSGLEIDALEGRPGVYSARYGGPGLSDKDRYEVVLRELKTASAPPWSARFRCVVALAFPDGSVQTVEDTIEGQITDQPQGEHGFGYDPIFFLPAFNATLAQVAPEIKNAISHRGKAALKAKQLLAQWR